MSDRDRDHDHDHDHDLDHDRDRDRQRDRGYYPVDIDLTPFKLQHQESGRVAQNRKTGVYIFPK